VSNFDRFSLTITRWLLTSQQRRSAAGNYTTPWDVTWALARTTPPDLAPGEYQLPDSLLALLTALSFEEIRGRNRLMKPTITGFPDTHVSRFRIIPDSARCALHKRWVLL